jgi:murein DD-endopeptidase MepM/ murein hydrolase activator NlpD
MYHLGQEVGEVVPTPVLMPTAPANLTQPATAPTATSTPPPLEAPTGTPEGVLPTERSSPTPAPASATPTAMGPLPPDIPRDPTKADITAANPACANMRDMPPATGTFIWPSPYQALSGGDFREGHPGLDLATPPGSPVHAADTGLVVFAGWSGLGYGNVVLIDHGNGFQTLYAHLSQVSIYCGAKVEKGKLVGLSGDTGNSSGPHLHFEVRVPGGYVDPLRVLPIP